MTKTGKYRFICLTCGKAGLTNRSHQKFCDTYCRQMHHDHIRRPLVDFTQCPFNPGIECTGGKCTACGWNPEVEKARKALLLQETSDGNE